MEIDGSNEEIGMRTGRNGGKQEGQAQEDKTEGTMLRENREKTPEPRTGPKILASHYSPVLSKY